MYGVVAGNIPRQLLETSQKERFMAEMGGIRMWVPVGLRLNAVQEAAAAGEYAGGLRHPAAPCTASLAR